MPRGVPKNAPPQGVKLVIHVSVTDDIVFDCRNEPGKWLDPEIALTKLEEAYQTARGVIAAAVERRLSGGTRREEDEGGEEQEIHPEGSGDGDELAPE